MKGAKGTSDSLTRSGFPTLKPQEQVKSLHYFSPQICFMEISNAFGLHKYFYPDIFSSVLELLIFNKTKYASFSVSSREFLFCLALDIRPTTASKEAGILPELLTCKFKREEQNIMQMRG